MTNNVANSNNWREACKIYIFLAVVGGISFVVSLFTTISLCVFYLVTGIPFLSCGMSRAFMSLPDVGQAFFYHPLFFTVPFIPLLVVVSPKVRKIATIVLILLFVGQWLIRLYLMFPHTAPMNCNEQSLIGWLRRR